ncbi:protein TSSC1, putative [Plasmodium vivax]|uniref:Protein TSSC1, putative n=1 Tax=Plasmodium vivax TaxID=5855 RepID=A0A1G4HKU6_PLAVI|nr:protein TSSC1, putative [Plasmodium vivax]
MMHSGRILKNSYYLPFKSKCLSSLSSQLPEQAYHLHYFLLGTSNPFADNEIHLIEYNDQSCAVRNVEIFDHKEEVKHLVCLDLCEKGDDKGKDILVCTSAVVSADIGGASQVRVDAGGLEWRCFLHRGSLSNFDEEEPLAGGESDPGMAQVEEANQESRKLDDLGEGKENGRENSTSKGKSLEGGKEKAALEKLRELRADQPYTSIKQIAVDDHEGKFRRIAVIDKYRYNIFGRSQHDMDFISSKNTDGELNFGTFDPHHENILTVISNTNVYGYDLQNDVEIFSTFANHKADLSSVDFNPNIPNVLVTSSNDGYVKFWDLRFLADAFLTVNIHSHWVTSIHFNNFHDELLLSTSTDNTVKLHRIDYPANLNLKKKETNHQLIKTFADHEESVYQGRWSKTDAWVFASLSYDGKCVVNSVPTEEKYRILL